MMGPEWHNHDGSMTIILAFDHPHIRTSSTSQSELEFIHI
jgi:hypothetical protein